MLEATPEPRLLSEHGVYPPTPGRQCQAVGIAVFSEQSKESCGAGAGSCCWLTWAQVPGQLEHR